jgi:hypothetical protein
MRVAGQHADKRHQGACQDEDKQECVDLALRPAHGLIAVVFCLMLRVDYI